MRLVRFALANPYTVIVGVLAVIVLGITCLARLPIDLLPLFETPAVQILTFYPGMPAEVMEKDITTRLERWTGQSAGIARQESRSMVGVSIVKDFFHEGVDPAAAIAQVSSYAMSDLFYLPPGTIPPMVMPFDPTATVPLALITVSSPEFDETKLYDVAYFDLRNRLQGISGVIAPAVYGGKLRRVLAYVDPRRLEARDLSPMDVVDTLRRFSTLIPTGTAKLGPLDYQVITNGMPARVEEMNDFPIRIDDRGAPVRIRDVGEVRDTHQIQTNVVRISAPPDMTGKRQVYIPIYRQPGANTVAVVDGIRAALASILERLPKGIDLGVVMDQSVYVRRAIRSLVQEGVLGALLAAGMILVFLADVRSTLVSAVAIPLSVLAAFIGLYFTGHSINAMTLGGLALAVGRLVDDAIVVVENTDRHRRAGKPAAQAALDAAAEVSMPVLVATLTTIVVFFPVVFLTGIGRFLFTPLALAVAFSIGASYLVAMLVVPVYCARFLGDAEHPVGVLAVFGRGLDRVREAYARWLERAMARRRLVLGAVAAVFVASLLLGRLIGTELFPEVDAGQFSVRLRDASGTRIERTEETVARVEQAIKEVVPAHELAMVIANAGVLLDWPAAYTPNAGPQDAFIEVQLADARSASSRDYARRLRRVLRERFPAVEFSFHTGGMVTAALTGGLPSPIDVQVTGNRLEVAHGIAERVRDAVAGVPGAVDVRVQQRLDYPALRVDVDRTRAAYLGLTPTEVVKNVVTSLNSSVNFDPAFWIDETNGNHYFLGAQYAEDDITSLATLENIPITGPGGTELDPVPARGMPNGGRRQSPRRALLKNVASFTPTTAPTEVNHVNISRVIDVFANVDGRDVGGVAADIERRLDPIRRDLPVGYAVAVRGEVQSMRESFGDFAFGFLLAAALVYLLMVAQFRSFLDPFVVMFAVPLGLIGVVAILLPTGGTLNVQSLMGIIFMVGIAVSNSVLLVEFANRLRAEGATVEEAAIRAARIRFRPIVMTSLAAVLGLLPMAIGFGHGSEANVPLARAVVGGLSVSTVLTLFVVPLLYRVATVSRGGTGGTPGRAALAVLCLGLPALGACSGGTSAKDATDEATSPPARVTAAVVERAALARTVSLAASVEAYEQAPVYAMVPGYVRDIGVDIGDRVAQGQVLATLEVPEMVQQRAEAVSRLAERRAELAKAETEAALQRTILQRSRGLRTDDAITAQDLDEALARAAQADAAVRLARARVASGEARVAELQALMRYASLRAPFAGVVTRRFVDRGALVQTATSSDSVSPVVVVARTDKLRVVVDVPEPDVPSVDPGDPAVLAVGALPGQEFGGQVSRVARALDPGSRTMRAEVDVPDPAGTLRPGMFGTLTIEVERHADALTVPEGAVRAETAGPSVYVIAGERVARRPIRTGLTVDGRIEILEGLGEGEQVVAAGEGVSDGTRVEIAAAEGTGH